MKEKSLLIDIKNREENNSISIPNQNNITKNNFLDSLFSSKSSYNELKMAKIIKLNIIKSKILIEENFEHNKDINKIISFVKQINEKYKNRPNPILSNLNKNLSELESIFIKNFEMNSNSLNSKEACPEKISSRLDINKIFGTSDISEILNDEFFSPLIDNINNFDEDSRNLKFPIIHNNSIAPNLFLNKKRKNQNEKKKK